MDNFKKLSKSKARKVSDVNAPVIDYQAKLAEHGLTRAQVIETERKLAKFANTMDSLVRIPFTKQAWGLMRRCRPFRWREIWQDWR